VEIKVERVAKLTCGKIEIQLIYLLGVIALGVWAMYQIVIDPITWDSAVAVILFLIVALPPFIFWLIKKHRKRTSFRPEYQLSQEVSVFKYETYASQKPQYTQLTLRMTFETYVEFVALLFDGQGTLPVINRLDDWQRKHAPHYVEAYSLPNDPEGRWYWEYETPRHRFKKSRITIGINFLATDYFDGYLVIRLTCKDGSKEQRLPFKVKRRLE
jgi:hypothetical protein